MRMKSARLFFLLAVVLTLTVTAIAQEGHPLTGTWYGDFGMTSSQRSDLTVIMQWDGKQTTGTVNPGPNAVPIKVARLDTTPGKAGSRGAPAQGATPAQPAVAAVPP